MLMMDQFSLRAECFASSIMRSWMATALCRMAGLLAKLRVKNVLPQLVTTDFTQLIRLNWKGFEYREKKAYCNPASGSNSPVRSSKSVKRMESDILRMA